MNDSSCENYDVNSQIRRKITMLKSNLCDNSDAFIFVKKRIKASKRADERNK